MNWELDCRYLRLPCMTFESLLASNDSGTIILFDVRKSSKFLKDQCCAFCASSSLVLTMSERKIQLSHKKLSCDYWSGICWVKKGPLNRSCRLKRSRKWTDLEEYVWQNIFIFIQLQIVAKISTSAPAEKNPTTIFFGKFIFYAPTWSEPVSYKVNNFRKLIPTESGFNCKWEHKNQWLVFGRASTLQTCHYYLGYLLKVAFSRHATKHTSSVKIDSCFLKWNISLTV